MGNFLTLEQITQYKRLSECNIEELAAEQAARERRNAQLTSGVAFARKDNQETEESRKGRARGVVLDLLGKTNFPELKILTLPGIKWKFETRLLFKREGANWRHHKMAHNTKITACENDRYVYYSAAPTMPRGRGERGVLRQLPGNGFTERSLMNDWVTYHFCNVDDYMRAHDGAVKFDFVWLDYTGPMTMERRVLVSRFFERCVRSSMVVTSLRARWNSDTSLSITKSGGLSQWMKNAFKGAQVLHDIEYQDGPSAMTQIGFAHPGTINVIRPLPDFTGDTNA